MEWLWVAGYCVVVALFIIAVSEDFYRKHPLHDMKPEEKFFLVIFSLIWPLTLVGLAFDAVVGGLIQLGRKLAGR